MKRIPRTLRLAGLATLITIVVGLSAFAPARKAELSPRFNHVMLYVSNLDSSIAFYTTAFDVKVAQRITEMSVTAANGTTSAPRAARPQRAGA